MYKKLLTIIILNFALQAQAFEDIIVTTNGKLTDIKIENNTIIDVCPLVTIMNEKNTLIVHPLKSGVTAFTVVKNMKDKFIFHVNVEAFKTTISQNDGFQVLSIDSPPENIDKSLYELDLPPLNLFNEKLPQPPKLREKEGR